MTKIYQKSAILFGLALLALSGCLNKNDTDEFRDFAVRFDRKYMEEKEFIITEASDIPTSGTATYRGYVKVDISGKRTGVGEAKVDVDFESGDLRMVSENYHMRVSDKRVDRSISGDLAIDDGKISGNDIEGTFIGTVKGRYYYRDIDEGFFVGDEAEGLFMRNGSASSPDILVQAEK